MEEILDVIPGGWGIVAIGAAALLVMRGGLRPVAKGVMKGYLAAAEGFGRATAEAKEELQDVYAEAKSERQAPTKPSTQTKSSASSQKDGE